MYGPEESRSIFYSYRRSAADNLLILLGQVWNLGINVVPENGAFCLVNQHRWR